MVIFMIVTLELKKKMSMIRKWIPTDVDNLSSCEMISVILWTVFEVT